MTSTGAQKVVAFSAGVTVVSVALNSMLPVESGGKGELPSMRSLIGGGITFTSLAAVAEVMPEIAGMFSLSILFTAATLYTLPMLDRYFTQTQTQQNAKTAQQKTKAKGKTK